ncbi:urea amidolyase associated protein UAAP1 [Rhodovulum strictum]|uniref:DUF1989 domain-containing protein n=1 Tax=Rhodovulum strictum TaxID=58314 RepID=A0A844BI73_9RHOB|nr:urea amidolyase associated protein UAAP1 [Rhodovulum strictum]MRH20663.1 DUF1989 domain-containing protein [Rhodovulum strictum]
MQHIPRSPEAIAADRARYEDHQRKGLDFAPRALPAPSPRPAPDPDPGRLLAEETIPGGWYWTTRLAAGETLRILSGGLGGSVSLAAWSAADPAERMNLPDTVKVQWTTELRKGRVILSDMGRVLLSITEDSSGAHDALTGGAPATEPGTPRARNTRDNMVLAAAKLGLDKRDLHALLTLFAPVRVDEGGRFFWNGALLSGDDWAELRAEQDLMLALSNNRHPLDPAGGPVPAIRALHLAAVPVAADDPCRTASAEAIRAFQNTIRA